MLVDLTIKINKKDIIKNFKNLEIAGLGHLGTHFDSGGKEFPLNYLIRDGLVFNVKGIFNREIQEKDINISLIKENMFIAFYTGFIDKYKYGTDLYYSEQPQLSKNLINILIEKKISIIGIDFAGIRKVNEHSFYDKHCLSNNIFIVENLCNLNNVVKNNEYKFCKIYTFPLKFSNLSGLPCRVVAEV